MELKQERVGKYLIRESCGIVERLFCIRCGRNLPWLEWDCPHCDKEGKAEDVMFEMNKEAYEETQREGESEYRFL